MAGALVPYAQQGFQLASLLSQAGEFNKWIKGASSKLKAWRNYNIHRNPLHSRKWAKQASMPRTSKYRTRAGRSLKRRGYKNYGRKRYSTAQKKVTRTRRAARRYGRVSAARKLKLPLGGFTQRKIIRLRDVCSFEPVAAETYMDGTPRIHTNGVAYADLEPEVLKDVVKGQNRQLIFRLNDLRNFYNQGKYVAPGGTTAHAYWQEPDMVTVGGNTQNTLRKIPLTHVLADQYKTYTVIGAEMTIRITNNEINQKLEDGTYEKASKIWYAWRITPQTPGDGSTPDGEIPEPVGAGITYQQLKETGRWRCGVVQSAQSDKDAMRTFKIKFNSRSMFGAADGQPGMPNVSALLRSSTPNDAQAHETAGSPPHVAWVQLIIGPQNESNFTDPNDPSYGSPMPTYSLQHVQVDIHTEFYVSLTDPYPIQAVDNDGIEFPSVPEAAAAAAAVP